MIHEPVSTVQYKNSEYDQEIPQSQTADKPMAPRGTQTTSSLFPIKMAARVTTVNTIRTIAYNKNIKQLQTPTMGVTINNKLACAHIEECTAQSDLSLQWALYG